MSAVEMFTVEGYTLAVDLRYDPETNLWIEMQDPGSARVGFDPLGAETTGDIVAISFIPVGTSVRKGEPLASVEAAKFVGPLNAPLSGTLLATNDELVSDPGAINSDPFGSWLVELGELEAGEVEALVSGRERIAPWFKAAVERFRKQGMIAR
ncbi:MAG: glycine cleavage system protein H [Solirubrobacteraceae bacterium]